MSVERPQEPRGWLFSCLCLLLTASVYVATLGAPFIWDDSRLILESPEIRGFSVTRAFLQPFWFGLPGEPGSSAYFRPITSLAFGLDYQLHGENSAGYHLSNLLFHLAATAVLFALLRRRRVPVAICFLLTACWALLPRLTEGVAWISGRGDVLASLFALLALWVYSPGARLRLAMASLLALAALLCKESGLAAFAALAVLVMTAGRRPPAPRARFLDLAQLAAPLALYLALRMHAGATIGNGGVALLPRLRTLAVLEAIGRYATMLVDPFQPRSFLGRLGEPAWPFVVLGALCLAALPFALWRARRADPTTLAYALLAAVPLALALHVFPLPVSVVASDRYLYLPTAALVLALAPVLTAWVRRQKAVSVALLLLAIGCAVRTHQRVGDYGEVASFWMSAVRDTPREAVPYEELAAEAYRSGCLWESYALNQRALQLNDATSPRALENTALVANLIGQRDLSNRLGDLLLQRYPGVASFELRRATSALASLDFVGARSHAERALLLDKQFWRAKDFLNMLARVREAWPASSSASLEARLALEMQALRYPETVETLKGLLATPNAQESALREGLEFVIRTGTPEDARDMLAAYFRHHTPADAPRLEKVVALRLQMAQRLKSQLGELHLSKELGR